MSNDMSQGTRVLSQAPNAPVAASPVSEPALERIRDPFTIRHESSLQDSNFVSPSKRTTILRFSVTAHTPGIWMQPADTLVCKYQDYSGPRRGSADIMILVDDQEEIGVKTVKGLDGGTVLLKVYGPVPFEKGETRFFTVAMDTTMFNSGDRLFFELQEFFRPDGIGVEYEKSCNFRTTLHFQ